MNAPGRYGFHLDDQKQQNKYSGPQTFTRTNVRAADPARCPSSEPVSSPHEHLSDLSTLHESVHSEAASASFSFFFFFFFLALSVTCMQKELFSTSSSHWANRRVCVCHERSNPLTSGSSSAGASSASFSFFSFFFFFFSFLISSSVLDVSWATASPLSLPLSSRFL